MLNARGEPVVGGRIELWQANALGRYDRPSDPNPAPLDPDFQGYADQRTDKDGRFRFLTIKPGPYPTDRRAIGVHDQNSVMEKPGFSWLTTSHATGAHRRSAAPNLLHFGNLRVVRDQALSVLWR